MMPTSKVPSGEYGRVVDTIGQAIVNGELEAGESLMAETVMQRLQVSRSVAREALRLLESMGLVQARRQRGTLVLPRERWNLLAPLVIEWRGKGADYEVQLEKLLELRLAIEPLACRLARERPEQTSDKLVEIAARMVEAQRLADPALFLEADVEFHRELLLSSGNAILYQLADPIEASLRTRALSVDTVSSVAAQHSIELHVQMAEALVHKRAEAESLCSEIVTSTLQHFRIGSTGP